MRTHPPLSPAFVKDTIAVETVSRRNRARRLDELHLFTGANALPDDPVEVQLLFAARDDYLSASTARERNDAMNAMVKLVAALRNETADLTSEMNRLLTTAMQSEVAQKRINAMVRLAEAKRTRSSTLTLSELIEESADAIDPGTEESAPADAGERRLTELQTESDAVPISPQ